MPSAEPTASVVVCAYTTARWPALRAALASAAAQTPAPLEVLLVVDHNAELARLARAELTGFRILDNVGPRGLSGARNTGVTAAAGDIIAFLDDDAAADPGWLAALLAPYADPDVIAVGGAADPVWPAGTGRPGWLPGDRVLDWVVGCTYRGLPAGLAEVRNVMGCSMSFRRGVFEAIGGFSDRIGRLGALPLGCEETELCIRARQRLPRARILFEPRSIVRHQVGAERMTWSYLVRRSWAEGVSKALVSRMAGAGDAVSTERSYVTRVLPASVSREVVRAAHGHPAAAAQGVAAIASALLAAGGGYLRESARRRERPVGAAIAVTEFDVHRGPVPLPVPAHAEPRYRDALVLVRDGRWTLDVTRLPVTRARLAPSAVQPAAPPERPAADGFAPPVSVVVPTADRAEQVRGCVKSLLATEYPDLEVVLVDNRPGSAASAGLAELAAAHPRVRYVAEPAAGVSRARNTGVAAARGELIAFVDDDIEVDRWWAANLAAEFAGTGVDCATSLVLPASLDTPAQRKFEELKGFGHGASRTVFGPARVAKDPRSAFAPGRFGPGGCAMWRRSTLDRLGGFDPLLGPGTPTRAGEDLELFLRLARSGGTVVYTPHAVAWHEHGAEWAALRGRLHAYGVGLSAMFVRHLLRRPGDTWQVATATARRASGVIAPRAARHAEGGPRARLLLAQAGGLAAGPFALAWSAWSAWIQRKDR
ncbi:glycosyltransferase [Amycolatopsis benzoatilytica]|uniref:glycosyltransferase n=1 Tax=Amycolatopsis benzoatilytica TaxID=346045 RepID=UPI00037B3F35|nr:glycosyltransferase [Amycolatopsis benzoatilytica]